MAMFAKKALKKKARMEIVTNKPGLQEKTCKL